MTRPVAFLAAILLLSLTAPAAAEPVYAAVTLNGAATDAVLELELEEGKMVADGAALAGLGLLAPAGPVALGALAGVTAAFDAKTQTLALTATPKALKLQSLSSRPPDPTPVSRAAWGGLVNYAVYGLAGEGTSAQLSAYGEVRLFGPIGVLSSGFAASPQTAGGRAVRLSSSYTWNDGGAGRRLVVGDFVSAGLSWARSVRAGGVSFASDFDLRPDLITQPIPAVSGSAAVPSTVDLYVNGVRRYAAQVDAGPFVLDQAPLTDGLGEVRVVVTDLLGQSSVQSFPYYATRALLRPGLTSYALEAGWVRLGYAGPNDRYRNPFLMAGGRRGLTGALTVEAHAEAAEHLALAGGGATAKIGEALVVSGAVSGSRTDAGWGSQLYLAAQRQTGRYGLFASALQSSERFEDLAARSGDVRVRRQLQAGGSANFGGWGTLSASYLDLKTSANAFGTVSLGWSRRLPFGGAFYANGYALTRGRGEGITIGLTMPLGGGASAGGAVTATDAEWSSWAYASRSPQAEGGLGWTASLQSTQGRLQQASADLRASDRRGEAGIGVAWSRGRAYAQGYLRGAAIYLAGDRLRLASTVSDSFAVVDAGAPGVEVAVENNVVGRSGKDGRMLTHGLRGMMPVTVGLEAASVPLAYAIDRGSQRVRPPRGAGMKIGLAVRRVSAVSLRLVTPAGTPVPVGARLSLNGKEAGVVGYDGAVYLQNPAARNQLNLKSPDGACVASFELGPDPDGDPPTVVCQPLTYAEGGAAPPPAPVRAGLGLRGLL